MGDPSLANALKDNTRIQQDIVRQLKELNKIMAACNTNITEFIKAYKEDANDGSAHATEPDHA